MAEKGTHEVPKSSVGASVGRFPFVAAVCLERKRRGCFPMFS